MGIFGSLLCLDNTVLVRHEGVLPSACWGSASLSWVMVLLSFVTVDQTETFSYTAQRSRFCWGSQGQDILVGDPGEKEMSGKAQTGEFIKRQNADSKEFFLHWNLFLVEGLPLQNTLNKTCPRPFQAKLP